MSVPHSPRPSPKRALSSPDASSHAHAKSSPRLTRSKLSQEPSTRDASATGPEINLEGPEREQSTAPGLQSITTTPPSPAAEEEQSFKGLGFDMGKTTTSQAGTLAQPAASAVEQQRRLELLPTELHLALAKLSSQHLNSDYNRMKVAIHQPPPVIASHSPSSAPLSTPLNRSHSSPPLGSQVDVAEPPKQVGPIPVQRTQASENLQTDPSRARPQAQPRSISFAAGWPNLIRPIVDLAAAAASAASSALGSPVSSRPSTPFERPRATTRDRSTPDRTGLTPMLGGLSCESGSMTPLEQPLAVPAARAQPAAEILRSALENTLARSDPPAAAINTPVLQTGPRVAAVTQVHEPFIPGMRIINGIPVRTSISHPINISHLVPPNTLAYFSESVFAQHAHSFAPSAMRPVPSHMDDSDLSSSAFRFERPAAGDLWDIVSQPYPELPSLYMPQQQQQQQHAPNRIGNFMLSSCPGKKVRLDGTALRGSNRNAICRDLRTDLCRAREQGVRLVICCLDDQELAFLGSPIDEYVSVVDELEMQLVRIPMVEGFAPTSPQSLDQELEKVIETCTLRGFDVLAHCRGGIGRAGLVACCWLVKMGIVGGDGHEIVQEHPMRVVERVIDVVRRRRSIKAIETPVQVSFLLAYVSYLQQQARGVASSRLGGEPRAHRSA
ncbi:hypothetical protein ACM66B_004461 [Microbotryomycetes sp. NB124-2]